MPGYRLLNHTADLGVLFYGPSPESLFVNAGLALSRLMMERPPRRGREKRRLKLEGEDRAELLVRFLSELLYLFHVQGQVLTAAAVDRLTAKELEISLDLAGYDPESHGLKAEIKAVTYHDLEIKPTRTGWRARVVFDL
ncbi:MAG: archease [Thermodesulfobacteriota bacterium]